MARPGGAARSVWSVLDDLEQQAAGMALVDRDLEVADRGRAEYAQVALAGRLHALLGHDVRLQALGGLALSGRVRRTGADFVVLSDAQSRTWVVPHGAIAVVQGARDRSVADTAVGVVGRLSLRSALRGLVDDEPECVLHLRDGARHEATLLRVGADFVDVALAGSVGTDLVPLAAVAAVQSGRWRDG